jgi:hypothetical protein
MPDELIEQFAQTLAMAVEATLLLEAAEQRSS